MEVQANNKKKTTKEHWITLSYVSANQMYLSHKDNILKKDETCLL